VPDALTVRELVKRYAGRAVVDELSFAVPAGTIFALLGPNGAGKTTTVECLEGFRRPDRGEVRVLGLDPIRDRAALAPRVGVMLQEGGAYQAASPRELLRLHARFYAQPMPVEDLLERADLAAVAGQRVRTLSGGERQRLNLALALVGQPEVLMLDEPTAGMDPQARQAAWSLVRELRDAGATVLLTTHAMDEAERLADLVAVIDAGRLLALDPPAALVAAASGNRVVVTTPATIDADDLARGVGALVTPHGAGRYLVAASPALIPAITAWFADRNLPLTGITAGDGSLEDVFLRLTGAEACP
jgi:ABC-2 type transport system ATP-binding protein